MEYGGFDQKGFMNTALRSVHYPLPQSVNSCPLGLRT
jgi:hypothetical protein